MSLESLPIETLHQILGYFCVHCSEKHSTVPANAYLHDTGQGPDQPSWYSLQRQVLVSICLTSKRLCTIAQPILYHEFVLGYGDSWRSDLYTWDGRLTSFMITIARRRDLARLVKRVYIHPYLLESFGEEENNAPRKYIDRVDPPHGLRDYITYKEARRAIRALAAEITVAKLRKWGAMDLISLLLAALPNLDRCSFQLGPYHDEMVRSAPLSAAGVEELPLRTLDVSLRSHSTHNRDMFSLDRVDALLRATPHLETLNLHMCHETWYGTSPPSLPNLQHIRLTFSRLRSKDLRALLASSTCPSLRSFHYETARHAYNILAPYDHFRLHEAVSCLRWHVETLESVHLDLRRRGRWMERSATPVVTFHDFPKLTYLLVNMEEFHMSPLPAEDILAQFLPPGIETVHFPGKIDHSGSRQEAALLGLANEISRGEFLNLKQIRCDAGERLKVNAILAGKFEAVGVDFGYGVWTPSTATLGDDDDELATFPSPMYIGNFNDTVGSMPPLPDEDGPDL
ncbi:hypothetical protein BJX64DRAFT_253768 [Aspergillus heterothallicus]